MHIRKPRKKKEREKLNLAHEQSVFAYILVGFAVAIIHMLISLTIFSSTRISAKSMLENHTKCGITTGGKVSKILMILFLSK